MMRRILFAEKNWRPDAHSLFHTGYYLVPEEMPAELAARAVAEGAAEVVEEEKPSSLPKKPKKADDA